MSVYRWHIEVFESSTDGTHSQRRIYLAGDMFHPLATASEVREQMRALNQWMHDRKDQAINGPKGDS